MHTAVPRRLRRGETVACRCPDRWPTLWVGFSHQCDPCHTLYPTSPVPRRLRWVEIPRDRMSGSRASLRSALVNPTYLISGAAGVEPCRLNSSRNPADVGICRARLQPLDGPVQPGQDNIGSA